MKKTLLTCVLAICVVSFMNAQTTFKPKVVINDNTGSRPYTIGSGQLDNDVDGYRDIVIGSQVGNTIEVYLNFVGGLFPATPTQVTNTLSSIGGLKLVDLDGQNGLDILAVAYTNDRIAWYPNDGSGGFPTELIISSSVLGASGLAVGDINDDGFPDIATTAYDGNNVVWFQHDGSMPPATPTFGSSILIDNTIASPGSVNFMDVDGDNDLDAIVSSAIYNTDGMGNYIGGLDVVEIFENDLYPSGMGLVSWTKASTSVDTGLSYMFNAAFVDLDGDSNMDILASEIENTNNAGSLYWYEDGNTDPLDGSAYTRTTWTTTVGNPAAFQLKDLDNVNGPDLILSSGTTILGTNQIVWFRNTGAGTFDAETSPVIVNTQRQTFVFTVNDFDNDGDLDIVSNSYLQNDLTWFENELITLGTDDFSIDHIGIYPNPSSDKLYFKGMNTNFDVSVYDILGKEILLATLEVDEALDVSHLSNGVYILKLIDQNKTFKIIKE